MDQIERICRVICEAQEVDPDRESIGIGQMIDRGEPYRAWQTRIPIAEALIAAGLIQGSSDEPDEQHSLFGSHEV